MKTIAAEPIKNVEDINEILGYFDSHNQQRNKLLFVLGVNTGLKISDILALKFKDVLNDDHSIKVKVTIQEKRTEREFAFYIDNIISDVFVAYVKTLDSFDMDDLIFGNIGNIGVVEHMLKKVINDELHMKIPIGSHSLRKTFVYHIVSNAQNKERAVDMIQKKFGYKYPSTVVQYACLN